jgi:hypothetical protein
MAEAKEKRTALRVAVEIQGRQCTMDLDTGATESIIPAYAYKALGLNQADIKPSNNKFRSYTGDPIPLKGVAQVQVEFAKQKHKLPLYVVDQPGIPLFGMSWINAFGLDKIVKMVEPQETAALVRQVKATTIAGEFPKLFNKTKAGTMKVPPVSLPLKPDAIPRYCRSRPIPLAMQGKLEAELTRLEKDGVIRPVEYSAWASPVVMVLKGDGRIRLCGDYKTGVNPQLEQVEYALPRVEDIFASMNGCRYFSKLDLSAAYNQINLDEQAQMLTTINTPKGLFAHRVLPFGVATAPAIFQRTIDRMLAGLQATFGYLDDLIVGGATEKQHDENLRRLLERLAEHHVLLNRDKCIFGAMQVEYLGHIISGEGLRPTEEKIKALRQAPAPTDTKTVRAFLGIVNYYGKFIPNLATTLSPLSDLLKADRPWQWGEKEQTAFEQAKNHLTSECCLAHYDPKAKLIITSDASPTGVGVILSQVGADNRERPVAFGSRKLSSTEVAYSQIEKEGLAIIVALRKFHHYVFGRRFTLRTDHRPLVSIFHPDKKVPAHTLSRVNRWALLLAEYTYDIEYVNTTRMAADFLSRAAVDPAPQRPEPWDRTINAITNATMDNLPVTHQQLATETRRDPILSQAMDYVGNGWPTETAAMDAELKALYSVREGLHRNRDVLMYGPRVVVPSACRERVKRELHSTHTGMVRMKALARLHVYWPRLNEELEQWVRDCTKCQQYAANTQESLTIPTSWPQNPWTVLNLDLAGPVAGKMLMILADQTSKWLEVSILPKTDSQSIISELRRIFSVFGLPLTLLADNASYFQSAEMQHFCTANGIRLAASAPYHPRTNGAAERAVQTVKAALRKMRNDQDTLQDLLSRFLCNYRNTPQTTTGRTPAEIMFGRAPRTRLDLTKPSTSTEVFRQQETSRRGRVVEELAIGTRVFIKEFPHRRDHFNFISGIIVDHPATYTYQVKLSNGDLVFRHRDHIRGPYNTTQQQTHGDSPPSGAPGAARNWGGGGNEESNATPWAPTTIPTATTSTPTARRQQSPATSPSTPRRRQQWQLASFREESMQRTHGCDTPQRPPPREQQQQQ